MSQQARDHTAPLNGSLGNDGRSGGGQYSAAPGEDLGDTKALIQIKDKRRTTDCVCCLVFLAFLVGFGFVVASAMQRGDPRRLYHGFDYKGNLCGVSPDVAGMPLMYWPRPDKMKYPICVGHCPDSTLEEVMSPVEKIQSSVSEGGKRVITIIQDHVKIHTYPSKEMGGRFCMPIADGSHHGMMVHFTAKMINQTVSDPMATISERFQDISNAWGVLVCMFPLSIMLGYLYLFFLKHCAGPLTWGVVFGLILSFAGLTYYLVVAIGHSEGRAEELLGKYTDNPVQTVQIMSYVSGGITLLLFCALCWLYKMIKGIVGCVEATCDAIWAMPFLLPLPVVDILLKIVFTLVWGVLFSWAISAGEVQVPEATIDTAQIHGMVRSFTYSDTDKFRIGYFILAFAWGLELMTAIMHFTISYCVACWYFTPCVPNSDYSKPFMNPHVFLEGLYRAFRYHLGSLALCAFIVAIFRILNGILSIIAKEANATGNPVAASIAHCCMCCVWCFEEIVRFINKNAIIEIVLKSKDFFSSAGSAIKLLAGAAGEVAGLNGITFIFQILGIVSITSTTAAASYYLTTHINIFASKSSELYVVEPLIVVAIGGLIGLMVSCAYMFIFDMVADTLIFCWLTDSEDGVTEFAPKPLRNVIGHPTRKQGQTDTAF